MGIEEVLTAPRSPWQNAYVERIIGSIRRIVSRFGRFRLTQATGNRVLQSRQVDRLSQDEPVCKL
jgi:hypothetical protein